MPPNGRKVQRYKLAGILQQQKLAVQIIMITFIKCNPEQLQQNLTHKYM